jgi:hypothetical protein
MRCWPGPPTSGRVEKSFGELRLSSLLGSSLSSGALRMRPRVRQEAPEGGIADAPLEAPQRLLTGLALRHLLAVVSSAPGVRPGLAYRDHMQGVVELAVLRPARACDAPPRRWRPPRAPYRSRRRSAPWSGSVPRRLPRAHDPGGQYGTYAEDLREAGAGSLYLGFDALVEVGDHSIQRPDPKRSTSEASRRRTRDEEPSCGRMPRRMRTARSAGASRLSRRARGLVEARAGG